MISSLRSKVKVHDYPFVGVPHKGEHTAEASTNTVFQLTIHDTSTDTHALTRIAGSFIEIARLRHAESGLVAMADQLDAPVC